MSKTITMNIRMDEQTRKQLQVFAAQIGISATSLVNASIREMLRTQRVSFSTNLEPTPYLKKLIKEAEADYAAGKNITTINDEAELKTFFKNL